MRNTGLRFKISNGLSSLYKQWFDQAEDEVLVRAPGNRMYGEPIKVSEIAGSLWEYAVQSENSYIGDWRSQRASSSAERARVTPPQATAATFRSGCLSQHRTMLPLPGWKRWDNFGSASLIKEASLVGLYVEVWEKEANPKIISVVFRGSDSKRDWISNLRWLLRFVPFYPDQYTVVAQEVAKELADGLVERNLHNLETTVVACGHSLGGGLAQHLAYSLPSQASDGSKIPRISRVYAFDPSPVTGWSSVPDKKQRDINANDLAIDRIFEHGEILAYVRLGLSYINPPSGKNPIIRELRLNFLKSRDAIKSHEMRILACWLIHFAGVAPAAPVADHNRGPTPAPIRE